MHIDILKALARHGPLKLTHIMYKANVNCSVLKQHLEFLMQQNLIEVQTIQKRRKVVYVVYAITEKGRTVLRHFLELQKILPVIEGNNKIPPLLY
jgi:predicted transcriptional regulator